MIGVLTTAQALIAGSVVLAQPRVLPARRHSTSSGMSRNSGYSFAAPPSPSRTPASTGLRRAHARMPVAAKAVASASKFVNAWTSSSGGAAISAASPGRSPGVRLAGVRDRQPAVGDLRVDPLEDPGEHRVLHVPNVRGGLALVVDPAGLVREAALVQPFRGVQRDDVRVAH